jgi:hypothetical protein
MYNSCYSNTSGVTTLPPLRNLVPRFTKEERFVRKQRMVIWTTSWFQRHECRHDHFLKVRIMPTIGEILHTEISFNVGSILTPLLSKKDEASVRSHLRDQNGKNL